VSGLKLRPFPLPDSPPPPDPLSYAAVFDVRVGVPVLESLGSATALFWWGSLSQLSVGAEAPSLIAFAVAVCVPGAHWRVEEAIKLAKSAAGMADYEVRSFHGWYRHITLAQLAAAF